MKTDLLQHSSFSLHPFFSRFDQFADAPDAVAKMRELVRTLAANGRLFGETESRECPTVRMKDVCAQITDGEHATPHRISSGVPLATAKNVRDGFLDLTNTDYVAQTTAEKCWRRCKPQHDDILMVCVGATTGRVCLAQNPPDIVLVRSVALIRPKLERIAPAFLDLFLRSSSGQAQIWGNVKQSAQPCLYLGKMAEFEICLPPLAEQKRIVAKVDELMALCDRLEAQQQERETRHAALARASLARFADAPSPVNLPFLFHPSYAIPPADLRKSILTLAVQGKLVPQDPNDEPAEEILARIAVTKLRLQKTGEIGKEKPVEPLQPDSLPFEAPDSWRWAKLAELTELITKGSSPKWQGIAYVPESEGILFITSENVGNYVLRKLDDLKYVSKGFNEIEPRSILKRGDILMNLVGASIGRTAVYDLHDGANINQAVALIRYVRETDGICPRFLLHYLNSPSAIDYMLSSRVVNAQPNISLTDAREFAVPVPPLTEQRRIVAKVEQLMALVDALETQLATSRATAANLLSALVAELTGTPNDGKVSVPSTSTTGRRGRPPKS